jgi:hypothetical protein
MKKCSRIFEKCIDKNRFVCYNAHVCGYEKRLANRRTSEKGGFPSFGWLRNLLLGYAKISAGFLDGKFPIVYFLTKVIRKRVQNAQSLDEDMGKLA